MGPPLGVVAALNAAKVPFVVLGPHALEVWTNEPQAGRQTEILVPRRWQRRAAQTLGDAPGHIPVNVNLQKPMDRLFRVMFRHTHTCAVEDERYRIPSVEMALALRYSSVVSPYSRGWMKYRDAWHFVLLMQRHPEFDREKLRKLGGLVHHKGGAAILKYVRRIEADDKPVV